MFLDLNAQQDYQCPSTDRVMTLTTRATIARVQERTVLSEAQLFALQGWNPLRLPQFAQFKKTALRKLAGDGIPTCFQQVAVMAAMLHLDFKPSVLRKWRAPPEVMVPMPEVVAPPVPLSSDGESDDNDTDEGDSDTDES